MRSGRARTRVGVGPGCGSLADPALGMNENVAVDVHREGYQTGDIYLLCSDGLSGLVTDELMLATVRGEDDLDRACSELIAQANANGGKDNITVALARIERCA